MLYKVVLTFKSVDEPQSATNQIKAIEHFFHVVVFFLHCTKCSRVMNEHDEMRKLEISKKLLSYNIDVQFYIYICGRNPNMCDQLTTL